MKKTEYVEHQDVKIYCTKNQFPPLLFYSPHNKPHGASRLGKHYHMHFDTKLVYGTCEIIFNMCTCTQCTSIPDKPWSPGVPTHQQPLYKPVTYFTY